MKEEKHLILRYRIEEIFLGVVIVIQLMDFFKILPGDLNYVQKFISVALIGYLIYVANISKNIFGAPHRKYLNVLIILSYFLFFFKDFIAFSLTSQEEVTLFFPLLSFLSRYGAFLEVLFFYIGGIGLIILSLYISFRVPIGKPSFMAVIHEEGDLPRNIHTFVERFLSVFFVLIMFFLFVFNLMAEWLAVAIDSPIIVFGILFYIFIIMRHHKKYGPDSLIYRVGDFGNDLYEKLVGLFHDKKTVYLGISGLLVLHLITDLAIFVVPYFMGIQDAFYYGSLDPLLHKPFLHLFWQDYGIIQHQGFVALFSLAGMYFLNSLALVFFLILPVVFWFLLLQNKNLDVHHIPLALFFGAVTAFLLMPAFKLMQIQAEEIYGVDIITFSLLQSSLSVVVSFLLSLGVILITLLLSYIFTVKKILVTIGTIFVDLFFGLYVYYFFMDSFFYYIHLFIYLVRDVKEYFIGTFFLIFMTFIIIFYLFGFLVFLKLQIDNMKRVWGRE